MLAIGYNLIATITTVHICCTDSNTINADDCIQTHFTLEVFGVAYYESGTEMETAKWRIQYDSKISIPRHSFIQFSLIYWHMGL